MRLLTGRENPHASGPWFVSHYGTHSAPLLVYPIVFGLLPMVLAMVPSPQLYDCDIPCLWCYMLAGY